MLPTPTPVDHRMIRLLSRIGLRWQIALLAAIGVVGLLLLAGLIALSDAELARRQAESDRATWLNEQVVWVDRSMLLAKKAEKNFVIFGNDVEIANHAAAMREVTGALDALAADLAAHPGETELAKGVAAIRASTDAYASKFADVVTRLHAEGWTEKQGMLAQLRNAGQALEDQADARADPRLRAAVLALRRQEDEFLLWLQPQRRDAFEHAFAGFTDTLGTVPDSIGDAATAYRRRFLDLAAAKLETAARIAVISRAYSDLAPTFAAVQNATRDRYAATRTRLAETRADLNRWSLEATGLLLTAVLAAALLTALAITRLLGTMTTAMRALAGGELDIRIPGGARRDELGQMAAALEVFREQMQQNRDLQAEQDATRVRAEVDKRTALVAMAETIERESAAAVAQVSELTERMDAAAETMSAIARRVDSDAGDALAAAGGAVVAAQTVANASQQLTASVGEITRQVDHSTKAADRAVQAGGDARASISALSRACRPDRRRGADDRRDRRAHQPASAERHHRGGPRRRGRPRLRGGRQRGEAACQPDRALDPGDQAADRRGAERDRVGSAVGRRHRGRDRRDARLASAIAAARCRTRASPPAKSPATSPPPPRPRGNRVGADRRGGAGGRPKPASRPKPCAPVPAA